MLQSKFVKESHPHPRYKHWILAGVRFTRAIIEPGMWQDHAFPACRGYAEIDSSHIQLEGIMIDPNDVLAPREAGWMSSNDWYPIPEGVHRRLAITRTVVWCARPLDKVSSVWHLDEVRVVPGDELVLESGRNLLLIAGRLLCDGTSHEPVTHLHANDLDKTLVAEELSYGFAWSDPKSGQSPTHVT